MKNGIKYMLSILFFLLISIGLHGQDEIVYQHPSLGIHFTASPHWKQLAYTGENLAYVLVNQNNNMEMKLWFEKTTKSVEEFLRNKVCKEGMVNNESFVCNLDNRDAYGISAICSEMRRPFKVMLIAIPAEDGLYLLSFKCPEECYMEHQEQIQKLLDSITFGPIAKRSVFYASNECP